MPRLAQLAILAPHTYPTALPNRPTNNRTNRDLAKGLQLHVFRYTKFYHRMAGAELVLDLLNDPASADVLQVMVGQGSWRPVSCAKISSVDVEVVPATLTRMDLFDKVRALLPAHGLQLAHAPLPTAAPASPACLRAAAPSSVQRAVPACIMLRPPPHWDGRRWQGRWGQRRAALTLPSSAAWGGRS